MSKNFDSRITANWSPEHGFGVMINLLPKHMTRKQAKEARRAIKRAIRYSKRWERGE